MNLKKVSKYATLALTASLIFSSTSNTVSAVEKNSYSNEDSNVMGSTSFDSEAVSEVMTFEEVVKEISNEENISEKQASEELISTFEEEAEKKLYNKQSRNLNSAVSVAITEQEINNMATTLAASTTYRTLSSTVKTGGFFEPIIRFYCATSESGSFRGIKTIKKVSLDRKGKAFKGDIYVHLQDPNKIFWILNGDFYNNGTTTFETTVSIGVKQKGSVDFKVSKATNHYKYVYKEGTRTF